MNDYNLIDKFYKLQKHIEKTLEQAPIRITSKETEINSGSNTKNNLKTQDDKLIPEVFETSHDFSTFDDIARHLPVDDEERILLLFSKLISYFNAGILFENKNEVYFPQIYFNKEQIFTFNNEIKNPEISIQMPQISIHQIIKLKNNDLLKKINLESLDPQNNLTILLIKPTSDFIFCFLSSLPDLWLREHAEILFQKLKRSVTP